MRLQAPLLVASLVAGAWFAFVSTIAVAKGPVDRIQVNGLSFSTTFAITAGEALTEFNPWGERYLGHVLDEAPCVGEHQSVVMYLKDGAESLEPIYHFDYYSDPVGGPGFIYLPGPGDDDWSLNEATIISGSAGRWHQASPAWAVLLASRVEIEPPATSDAGLK